MQEHYENYKKLLFTLAYQLTGSVEDAEDAVQDVFVKFYTLDPKQLEEPKAYLCKMVTNHCLDLLKSARKKREQYFGPWLPEPIPTSAEDDLSELIVRSDLLSYAMLVLLERLSPAERAVFVLREALRFEYKDIAKLISKSEANCRKLMSRAKAKLGFSEKEPIHIEAVGEHWVKQFIVALEQGEVDTVLSLLAEDVTLISDGGGKAAAAVHPIESRTRVVSFLFGLLRKAPQYEDGFQIELALLNGQTGIIVRSGRIIVSAALMHVEQGVIKNLYLMRNPDKLNRL